MKMDSQAFSETTHGHTYMSYGNPSMHAYLALQALGHVLHRGVLVGPLVAEKRGDIMHALLNIQHLPPVARGQKEIDRSLDPKLRGRALLRIPR